MHALLSSLSNDFGEAVRPAEWEGQTLDSEERRAATRAVFAMADAVALWVADPAHVDLNIKTIRLRAQSA